MVNCLYVGIGGFIGSVLRYLCGQIPIGAASGFPIKTLLINLGGAFLLGILAALAQKWQITDSKMILLLKTGVCGGFTTFSTFAYESVDLLHSGQTLAMLIYVSASVLFGILAIFAAQAMVG